MLFRSVTIATIEPSQCCPHNPVKGPMHVDPNHCMVYLGKKSYIRRKSKRDFKKYVPKKVKQELKEENQGKRERKKMVISDLSTLV